MDHKPVPPRGGWNIKEAGDALLPDLSRDVWSGVWSDPLPVSLRMFSVDVLRALLGRDDLCITGRDFTAPADSPRITLSRDFYPDSFPGGFVTLNMNDDSLTLRPQGGRETRLQALKVELRQDFVEARIDPLAGARSEPTPARTRQNGASDDAALAWMVERQREAVKKHGRPMARDALAAECKEETGFPTSKGRLVFQRLPPELRNPPRT